MNTTIDPDLWKVKLRPFEAEIQAAWGSDWTWTAGGCFAFAEAFQSAFGGEFYGICRISEDEGVPDLAVDHALVMLDGTLYDHDGPYDPSRVRPDQALRHRDDDYVCWFEDDFFDDDAWQGIHDVLQECANEVVPKGRPPLPTP